MDRANALNTLPIFEGIDDRDIEPMLQCIGGTRRRFSRGTLLLTEADEAQWVGIVLSGQVNMIKTDSSGNVSMLAFMKPGELFGETFVCGSRRESTVSFQAASDCEVLCLPFARVMNQCDMTCMFHHRLIANMTRILADTNRRLLEKAEITAQKTLRDKILLYLGVEQSRQGGSYITSPLSKRELAEYLCADRSALSRELSRMRSEGIIDYDRDTYRIL